MINTSSSMPAWFENAKLYISPIDPDGADQRIYDLLLISRSVNKFMDTVHIEGDQTAMSIIEQTHKWFFEFCDWRLLQPKSGDFETLRRTALRLAGLSVQRGIR